MLVWPRRRLFCPVQTSKGWRSKTCRTVPLERLPRHHFQMAPLNLTFYVSLSDCDLSSKALLISHWKTVLTSYSKPHCSSITRKASSWYVLPWRFVARKAPWGTHRLCVVSHMGWTVVYLGHIWARRVPEHWEAVRGKHLLHSLLEVSRLKPHSP